VFLAGLFPLFSPPPPPQQARPSYSPSSCSPRICIQVRFPPVPSSLFAYLPRMVFCLFPIFPFFLSLNKSKEDNFLFFLFFLSLLPSGQLPSPLFSSFFPPDQKEESTSIFSPFLRFLNHHQRPRLYFLFLSGVGYDRDEGCLHSVLPFESKAPSLPSLPLVKRE